MFAFCAVVGFVIGLGAAWVQRVDVPLTHGAPPPPGTYVVAQAVFVAIWLAPRARCAMVRVSCSTWTVVTFAGALGGYRGLIFCVGTSLGRRGAPMP